jgi:hypothetical protein
MAFTVPWWILLTLTLMVVSNGANDCPISMVDASNMDSNYGTGSWSWLPPGPTCTWTVADNGVDARTGPGSFFTAMLGVTAAAILLLVATRRRRA